MKYMALVLAIITLFMLAGCSGGQAGELFETAQFEELQRNSEHAEQLYMEIIEKYPESEYAEKAEERLSVLNR